MSLATRTVSNERRRLVLRHLELHPLFQDMAARQGIDLAGRWWNGLESMLLRALGRCAHCRQTKACRAWLSRAAPGAAYPAFCPNSRVLEACRIMAPDTLPHSGDGRNIECPQPASLTELLDDPLVRQLKRPDREGIRRLLDAVLGRPRRLAARLR